MSDETPTYNWIDKRKWVFGWLSALIVLIVSLAWFFSDKEYESGLAVIVSLTAFVTILFKKGAKGLWFGSGIILGASLVGALLFLIPQFGSREIKEEVKQVKEEKGGLESENVALKKRISDLETIVVTPSRTPESPRTPTIGDEPPPPTPTPTAPPIANISPLWVRLDYDIQWRITGIQPQENFTRFFIEVRNTDEKSEHLFRSFGKMPLVMIDNTGRLYKMITSSEAPEKIREDSKHWYLQAGRTIEVKVDFEPLARGKNSGHLVYQDENKAERAKFSFTQ